MLEVIINLAWVDAGMLDHVNVMSHGVQTPLSHVAAVSVSSLEMLTVMPYDSSVSPDNLIFDAFTGCIGFLKFHLSMLTLCGCSDGQGSREGHS